MAMRLCLCFDLIYKGLLFLFCFWCEGSRVISSKNRSANVQILHGFCPQYTLQFAGSLHDEIAMLSVFKELEPSSTPSENIRGERVIG